MMTGRPSMWKRIAALGLVLGGAAGPNRSDDAHAAEGALVVRVDQEVRTVDRRRLVGSNLCLWHEPGQIYDEEFQAYLRHLNPTFLRIPGGSWADEYYWNGNGVRQGDTFDETRLEAGQWQIDYTGYMPGFRVQGAERRLSDYHGVLDVRALHQYVEDHNAKAIVTVNAGTGTPELAAEWVRWANLRNRHRVGYWEIGNELEGEWELGHFLPNGAELNGHDYAKRFIAFARAMKAVDPTIKVGGAVASNDRGGFSEDLLRIAGDHVDFISFHTYPVEDSLASEADIFARARSVGPAIQRFQNWVNRYQPHRAQEIEIGITEWNMKVMEDRDSADLITGLWTSIWVGEMMRAGVAFATQWDLLTRTPEGGHGAFFFAADRCLPESQFWSLYLWSRFMGDHLVAHELTGLDDLYVYPTRSGDELRILLVNTDRKREARIQLETPGFDRADNAFAARLSHAEYFWDPFTHRPAWSQAPEMRAVDLSAERVLSIPPFSAKIYRLVSKDFTAKSVVESAATGAPHLELLLPESAPADLPIEGWVLVRYASGSPAPDVIEAAGLILEGPATPDRHTVRVREAAGRFFLRATGAGPLTVKARAGQLTAKRRVRIEPVKERPTIYWQFDDVPAAWNSTSSFPLTAEDAVRPNQSVAAVLLQNAIPDTNQDTLLAFEQLPPDLPRDRIGGVVFDVNVSSDFMCADPQTQINVILQSESAHWIQLGSLNLNDLKGKWQSATFPLPDPAYHRAMHAAYALRFQISQPDPKKSPVTGRIHFDDVGFLLR